MKRVESPMTAGVIFLLWPFVAFVRSFFVREKPWAKNIVWLFVAFFGFTLIVDEGRDASRYIDWFLRMRYFDWSFSDFFRLLYTEETKFVDVLQPLLSFLVSLFTDDPRVLFAVFGLVFGYFYSRNLWFLLDRFDHPLDKKTLLLIATFAVIVGFWEINGFRFWTAAHIFIFGVLQHFFGQAKKGLIFAFLSAFVHFAFIVPCLLLLIHLVSRTQIKIFYSLFVVSFFLSEIDFGLVRDVLSFFPDLFYDRANLYVNEDLASRHLENATKLSWHAFYYGKSLKVAVFLLGSYLFFNKEALKNNAPLASLVSFALILYAVANVLSTIPSFGRFLSVGALAVVAAVVLLQSDGNFKQFKSLILISVPFLLFFDFVAVRTSFDYLGFYSVFGNPITALFGPGESALIDFIK